MCTSIDKFSRFGIGLYFYFKFLKYMSICFCIMSILMIPSMVSNLTGSYLTTESKSALDKLTVANQKSFTQGTLNTEAEDIIAETRLNRALLLTGDMLYTIFYLLFIIFFRIRARFAYKKLMREEITVSDYTLYVTGIPREGVSLLDVE